MVFDFRIVVYINGIKFDPRCVTYFTHAGSLHQFLVEVPPVPSWDILPPRSHGVVFFTDPITRTWRMFCEGEYMGTSRSKSGTGSRNRCLIFRALHDYWETATYTSVVSLSAKPDTNIEPTNALVLARANGRVIPLEKQEGQLYDLLDFKKVVENSSSEAARVPTYLPRIIETVTIQTPTEKYYSVNRKLDQKIGVMRDTEIVQVMDYTRFRDLAEQVSNMGLGPNTTLADILAKFEYLMSYQHISLPAPYCYMDGVPKIMETLFVPLLYPVVPPACNVIFADQIQVEDVNRNFAQEPTRVVYTVTDPITNKPTPYIFMANQLDSVVNVLKSSNTSVALTHDMLSEEELIKGVIVSAGNLGSEKFILTKEFKGTVTPEMEIFIEEALKVHLFSQRSRAKTCQLTCSFLPYLVPGFPCLVEDSTGPFFGIINNIQHTMPCQGQPSTTVQIINVREAYVQQGKNRNSPFPRWLNDLFAPQFVAGTYKAMLGVTDRTAMGAGAMVAENKIRANSGQGSEKEANLDELARSVMHIPVYSSDLSEVVDSGENSSVMADKLRATPTPDLSMLTYQFRIGMSLSQFCTFHDLASFKGIDNWDSTLPDDLTAGQTKAGQKKSEGHPLFAHPQGLEFVGAKDSEKRKYGIYNIYGKEFMPTRQNSTLLIKQAVDKMISKI